MLAPPVRTDGVKITGTDSVVAASIVTATGGFAVVPPSAAVTTAAVVAPAAPFTTPRIRTLAVAPAATAQSPVRV